MPEIKMRNEELEQVSGGFSKEKLRKAVEDCGYETRECRICHKEFQHAKFYDLNFSGSGEVLSRAQYYAYLCGDCAKEHPYRDLNERTNAVFKILGQSEQ